MIELYLADDERWVLMGLRKLIQKSGLPYQVIGEADNGLSALKDLRTLRPQALFTDIRMPGLTGLELIQTIDKEKLDIQTVLISGYSDFEYARTALRFGVFDYILKPIKEEELFDILSRLAESFQAKQKKITEEEIVMEDYGISMIVQEIQNNYTKDLSLQQLAEKYGISSGYLSVLLKKELGVSFSKYITSKRMQLARELLKDKRLSIDSVAQQTGYHDYFYFTKVFKETQGISPSKYRKELM